MATTKKQLPAATGELAKPTADKKTAAAAMQMLRSCRLQFQNPATFEVTSVYVTRLDARRYRVKTFKGGKCLKATNVDGDDFLDVLNEMAIDVFNS